VLAHVVDSSRCPRIDLLQGGFAESAHATAFGKLMLATLTPGARRSYLVTHGMPSTAVERPVSPSQRPTSSATDVEKFGTVRGAVCVRISASGIGL